MTGFLTLRKLSLAKSKDLPIFATLVNTINYVSNRNFLNTPPVADAIIPSIGSIDKPSARVVYLFDTMANHQKRDIFKLENGCWETNRSSLEIWHNGKTISFKAFIYEQETGKNVPDGSIIKNACLNKRCVNPSHFNIITKEPYQIDPKTGCWINNRASYTYQVGKKAVNIARFLYEKHACKLDAGERIKRVCNTHNCVNPNHHQKLLKQPEYFIDENGCWVCTSKTTNHKYGYPYIYIRSMGRSLMLSKYNYIQKYGELPDGMEMRHKCDNKRCINPDHMEPGTHKQNMEDMANRGRAPRGTRNFSCKLTIEQAKFIKFDKSLNANEISAMFNVSRSIIWSIRRGDYWAWLKKDSTE